MSDSGNEPVTKLDVWKWLRDHGPAQKQQEIADALGADVQNVNAALRDLRESGHVSTNIDWEWVANPADELYPLTSPFGAGAGPVSGEEPQDEPGRFAEP